MTIEEFEAEIGSEAANEYYRECSRSGGVNFSYRDTIEGRSSAIAILGASFTWDHSRLGHDYWSDIANRKMVKNIAECEAQDDVEYERKHTRKRIKQPLWVRCSE